MYFRTLSVRSSPVNLSLPLRDCEPSFPHQENWMKALLISSLITRNRVLSRTSLTACKEEKGKSPPGDESVLYAKNSSETNSKENYHGWKGRGKEWRDLLARHLMDLKRKWPLRKDTPYVCLSELDWTLISSAFDISCSLFPASSLLKKQQSWSEMMPWLLLFFISSLPAERDYFGQYWTVLIKNPLAPLLLTPPSHPLPVTRIHSHIIDAGQIELQVSCFLLYVFSSFLSREECPSTSKHFKQLQRN